MGTAEGLVSDNFDEIQEIIGKVDEEIRVMKDLQKENDERYDQVLHAEDVSKNSIKALTEEIQHCREEINFLKEEQEKQKKSETELNQQLRNNEDLSKSMFNGLNEDI